MDRSVTSGNVSLAGLTLLMTFYVLDQVPNANPLSLTFLIAGAVGTAARARVSQAGRSRRTARIAPSAPELIKPTAGELAT